MSQKTQTPVGSNPSFTARMKQFFGLLPGQVITGFAKELSALSFAEKMEFHDMLTAAGFPGDVPVQPKK